MNAHTKQGASHYRNLLLMSLLSFFVMYLLMYAMVDRFENILHNVNQVYMTMLMTASMVLLELLVMREKNLLILIFASSLLLLSFIAVRKQVLVDDQQFLKSMIPHHGAAILMAKEAVLKDPELRQLATEIIAAQEREIKFMKAKL